MSKSMYSCSVILITLKRINYASEVFLWNQAPGYENRYIFEGKGDWTCLQIDITNMPPKVDPKRKETSVGGSKSEISIEESVPQEPPLSPPIVESKGFGSFIFTNGSVYGKLLKLLISSMIWSEYSLFILLASPSSTLPGSSASSLLSRS